MMFETGEERLARYKAELGAEIFHHRIKIRGLKRDIEDAEMTDEAFFEKYGRVRGQRFGG
jgi:hypothetical protein